MLLALLLLMAPRDPAVPPDPGCKSECTLLARQIQGSVRVDGVLDEGDWQIAPIATNFTQFEPQEGAPATHQTEVRILYGASALYIGATLHDSEPNEILGTLGRRDMATRADWFVAAIDSYHDRKTAYNFAVNAGGVQADGIYTGPRFNNSGDDDGFEFDTSWDAIWDAAVRTTATGWVVEMRIPYSMLRFSDDGVQQWGVNFSRFIPRLSELSEWVMVPRSERSSGTVAQFGTLEGITNISPRRNLQVIPYSVSRLRTEEGEVAGTVSRGGNIDVGGDIKVGLTTNFTLDATVNPDFGQVDADPAELNLTAFESFFPERRPFFTEGTQIFSFNLDHGGSLLYTRRIGSSAPIIGAAKVSGRSGRGLSVGLFGAATGNDFQPGSYYGVGRLKQQIRRLSNVGGMATYVDHSGGSGVRSAASGMDWDLRFRDNRYKFDGQFSTTYRSVPDSDVESGFALTAGLDRQRSAWNLFSGFTLISDGFNPNDLGRLRRNNYINVMGGVSHQVNGGAPFGPFQRGSARLFLGNANSYDDGISNGFFHFFRSDWITRGFQVIELGVFGDYLFGGYDITETRGLGPRARTQVVNIDLSVTSDVRRKWILSPQLGVNLFGDGGRSYGAGLGGEWNISSRLNISAELMAEKENDVSEWASNEAFAPLDGGWAIADESRTAPEHVERFVPFGNSRSVADALARRPSYDEIGRHYVPVFGLRDTRAVDMTLRGTVTLTPKLSIQFFGQLFVARGTYDTFSLLVDRDTLLPVDHFPKLYDFSISSFQTNTVLRWEYRPGSSLFVVWSQSRQGDDDFSVFDNPSQSPFHQHSFEQLRNTFNIFPTNVFLIKLNYTFLR